MPQQPELARVGSANWQLGTAEAARRSQAPKLCLQ